MLMGNKMQKETRRRARDLLWVHTHYSNSSNTPKGQETSLVVSKERAKQHAEIYTPKEVVEFMYRSLVSSTIFYNDNFKHIKELLSPQDKEYTPFKFKIKGKDFYNRLQAGHFIEIANFTTLEPSCGSGNFLETIITDKIRLVSYAYRKKGLYNAKDPSFYLSVFLATSTLYAGDLQPDNVKISRARVFHIISKACKAYYKQKMPLIVAKQFAYLLRMTITHCNFLIDGRIYPILTINAKGEVNYIFKTFAGQWFGYTLNEKWSLNKDDIHTFTKHFLQMRDVYHHYLKLYYTHTYQTQKADIEKHGFKQLEDMESNNPYAYAKGITFSSFYDMEGKDIDSNNQVKNKTREQKEKQLKVREEAEKGIMPKVIQPTLF